LGRSEKFKRQYPGRLALLRPNQRAVDVADPSRDLVGAFFDFASSLEPPIRAMVRLQAARHSDFVMCVPRSQKVMQSSSVLPPPPGALAAASLGLVPADGALVRLAGTPPLDNGAVVSDGDWGGSGASEGEGEPTADEGAGFAGVAAGLTGAGNGVVGVVAPRVGLGEVTCAPALIVQLRTMHPASISGFFISCLAPYSVLKRTDRRDVSSSVTSRLHPPCRAAAPYRGGNRVRSQVLDQSSRDARVVSGFHIAMHSG
jgi:hypothetical protein